MEKLLQIEGLSLELKRDKEWNPILSDVSFTLEKGETLGIVGESGSGKSVTALSIMQLLSPGIARYPSGKILFQDHFSRFKGTAIHRLRQNDGLLVSFSSRLHIL